MPLPILLRHFPLCQPIFYDRSTSGAVRYFTCSQLFIDITRCKWAIHFINALTLSSVKDEKNAREMERGTEKEGIDRERLIPFLFHSIDSRTKFMVGSTLDDLHCRTADIKYFAVGCTMWNFIDANCCRIRFLVSTFDLSIQNIKPKNEIISYFPSFCSQWTCWFSDTIYLLSLFGIAILIPTKPI